MPAPETSSARYFVSHENEVKGPFDLDMIEAFILSGYYPHAVKICAEGSDDWRCHSSSISPSPKPTTPQDTQAAAPKPTKRIPTGVFVVAGILGLLVLGGLLNNGDKASSSSNYNTSSPMPAATDTTPQSPEPQSSLVSDDSSSSPSADTPAETPADAYRTSQAYYPPATTTPADMEYTTANGNTYRVSNSDFIRLSRQRTVLDQEDAAVSAAQAEFETAENRLERQRATLDRTNSYEVEDFNEKVDALNAKRTQLRHQIATYNNNVGSFNAELHRVGTLIR